MQTVSALRSLATKLVYFVFPRQNPRSPVSVTVIRRPFRLSYSTHAAPAMRGYTALLLNMANIRSGAPPFVCSLHQQRPLDIWSVRQVRLTDRPMMGQPGTKGMGWVAAVLGVEKRREYLLET